MENGKKKLLPISRGTSIMISGFMCQCHGFMSACIRGETHKSYKTFEAGKGREGWFTNKDLNDQFDACHELFRHFLAQKSWLSETIEKYPGCFLFFYPKYHCELNFIEMVWGWIKSYHRNN